MLRACSDALHSFAAPAPHLTGQRLHFLQLLSAASRARARAGTRAGAARRSGRCGCSGGRRLRSAEKENDATQKLTVMRCLRLLQLPSRSLRLRPGGPAERRSGGREQARSLCAARRNQSGKLRECGVCWGPAIADPRGNAR